ncbi:MAG: amidohydrolase family protein [Methyloligellaceae bacterium]
MASYALINLTLITLDPAHRVIRDGALVVADDRILAVGGADEVELHVRRADTVIDGRDMVALPGFVNAHTHTFQSLLRGLADGLDLLGFLRDIVYPVTPAMTSEDARLAAALSIVEAIKSGTTCLIDNHSADTSLEVTNDIARVFSNSGIRGLIARGLRQPTARAKMWHVPEHVFQYSLDEEIEITRDLIERWRRPANGRVQICPAPLTLFLAGPDDLRAANQLAEEYGTPVHIHVAETSSEVDATVEDYGLREVAHLANVGVLNERCHVVHGVWLDDEELDLLAAAGGHVIHCPTSNMSLASGIARVPELAARGVNVALASDGIGNHNHDMFGVLKTTVLLQRVHTGKPDVLTPMQILEMATLGGARALGLQDEIGSLEPGKKADVILIDMQKPHLVPVHDIATAIVHGATAADVDTVIVDGQFLMRNRRLETLDEHMITTSAGHAARELVCRAGLNSQTVYSSANEAQAQGQMEMSSLAPSVGTERPS